MNGRSLAAQAERIAGLLENAAERADGGVCEIGTAVVQSMARSLRAALDAEPALPCPDCGDPSHTRCAFDKPDGKRYPPAPPDAEARVTSALVVPEAFSA